MNQTNIHVGDTVIWHNADGVAHTVTADNGSFDSSPTYPNPNDSIAPSKTYSHKFKKKGTVKYHCKIHTKMKGTVTVTP